MLHSTARYETPNARSYMIRLCKHFGHKIEVSYDDNSARCAMPMGPATMQADDTALTVTVSAPDEAGLAPAKAVIDSHLERFAFREGFTSLPWQDPV